MAREQHIATIHPEGGPDATEARIDQLAAAGRAVTLLIDDTELFIDTPAGEWLTALIQHPPGAINVFASGRVDDLALAFRGIAAELKRARTGVLLQPGPGDGELFGLQLPYHRRVFPPGRGLLIAPDLLPESSEAGPLPLQVAMP